jgi:hypothetical protein
MLASNLSTLHGNALEIHLIYGRKRFTHNLILSADQGRNARTVTALLHAKAGDCTGDHQLLNLARALEDRVNPGLCSNSQTNTGIFEMLQ